MSSSAIQLCASRPVERLWNHAFLGLSLAVYLAFALCIARTKAPWCDEGVFANAAYNLAAQGHMGANVVEPSGHFLNAYLRGIQQRTYIVVPNYLVALAGWFRTFGFSAFTMRTYSIFWGAFTLIAFSYLLTWLLPDFRIARLTTLLLSVDFIYIWSTADGRMEAMAAALALCGIGAYVRFRERRLRAAILLSQICGAAAVFTHPNALLGVIAVLLLACKFDRARLRPRFLALAALPYMVFAALWALYIAQSPGDFKAQFFANAAGRSSERWKIILQPWFAVAMEAQRHIATYMQSSMWSGVMNQWMVFVPIGYFAACTWFLLKYRKEKNCGSHVLLLCAATYIAGLTFLNGFKAPCYFIYLIPFYDAALASWIVYLWNGAPSKRLAAASILAAFFIVQISTTVMHIRADEYAHDYLPAVQALEQDRAAGKTVVGPAALGFAFGFHGFRDDARLGMYSGLQPDVIVLDRSYRVFSERFETEEPAVFEHVVNTINYSYRLREKHGSFWLLERLPGGGNGPAVIDLRRLDLKEPSGKADYFFELLGKTGPQLSLKDVRSST